MQQHKKSKRKVTVDAETGSIAIDGFEVEKEQWSSLIPSVISHCEAMLSSLLDDDNWNSIADLTTPIKVGPDFSISMPQPDGSFHEPTFSLKHPVDLVFLTNLPPTWKSHSMDLVLEVVIMQRLRELKSSTAFGIDPLFTLMCTLTRFIPKSLSPKLPRESQSSTRYCHQLPGFF
jgi:hypothetical protein